MIFTIGNYRVEIVRLPREEWGAAGARFQPTAGTNSSAMGSFAERDKYMDEMRSKAIRLITESGMPLPR
ncbi:MAG TPA: hypothetical protein GX506_11405 [Firmicutes bacterium]|nr:hypothetical protein [Bacillota bacterium]